MPDAKLLPLEPRAAAAGAEVMPALTVQLAPMAGTVLECCSDGLVTVALVSGATLRCEVLCDVLKAPLESGARVLVAVLHGGAPAVILGRMGRYVPPGPEAHVVLEASGSLRLQCGEASLELRADGKVLLKGDDVLIRAKGTQRIRAGNVAIN